MARAAAKQPEPEAKPRERASITAEERMEWGYRRAAAFAAATQGRGKPGAKPSYPMAKKERG